MESRHGPHRLLKTFFHHLLLSTPVAQMASVTMFHCWASPPRFNDTLQVIEHRYGYTNMADLLVIGLVSRRQPSLTAPAKVLPIAWGVRKTWRLWSLRMYSFKSQVVLESSVPQIHPICCEGPTDPIAKQLPLLENKSSGEKSAVVRCQGPSEAFI